jgi:ABC-type branched-subunit amino acid transport system permease subunit
MYGFLADLMVAIHVSYVAYVVLGQVAIWVGWAFGSRFARNFWFRSTHLLSIAVVAFEQVFDIRCPLTVWEETFREKAGQPISGETFLGRLMHSLLFHDFQPWVFAAIYYTTLAVVALTLILCPPRWPFRRSAL